MKTKTLLTLALSAFSFFFAAKASAQDVVTLNTTDSIGVATWTYTGNNIVVVIPSGYTNPQGTNTINALKKLAAGTKVTLRGDGSMPTLAVKTFAVPANLASLKFENLTLTGSTTDPTANYIINVATGTATTLDSVTFNNCNISTFRSLVRFQSTNTTIDQKANNITINNCKICNFADYGVVYNNKVGASMGVVKARKSTFYGFGQNVFLLQTNTTSVDISDCTFDNVMSVTASKYLVDLSTQVVPVTISNCILGKTLSTAGSIKTAGTLTISNTYNTTDWLATAPTATAGLTGAFTAYTGASTDLFTSPSTSTPGSSFVNTGISYKIKDANFTAKNSAGDPRWYYDVTAAVNSAKSKGITITVLDGKIQLSEAANAEIINISGKAVKSVTDVQTISTSDLATGIYIVKATNATGSKIQKVVIK
ncbi:MAG: T9SS type A sorting domain-containing protein [Bacteroidota bacterium]|nr:T9SS type A sorting domain-containing protein [Bacteroidota bacterium]